MKILVVAPQPFFSPRGTPFSVYYRTAVTCELGHVVDLLTYGQGADVDLPCCRIVRIPAFRWLGAVTIGPSFLKLFLDCFMMVWTVGMLMVNRYDVVHAHEEAVFWCRWLKPLFRFRLVYDMHSSLPQQLHNFEFTNLRVVHWVFERMERGGVRAADAVVVICPSLRDHARALTTEDKVVLIENSLYDPVPLLETGTQSGQPGPTESVTGEELERWMRAHKPGGIIAYAGTLEAYQGIDRLLEAFSAVSKRIPESGLLIIGGSPAEVERYRMLADQTGLGTSVHFTGWLTQLEAQRLVEHADASVSPRISGSNTPMKIYQLMAMGMPIIATRIESHTQVLDDEIAFLSDVTPDSMAEMMFLALRDKQRARSTGLRAQARYHENYSREKYTAKMHRLFALVT